MAEMRNESSKKTILHIVISFETGGLERFVLDLIRLSANHFNHRVVCLERPGELVPSGGLNNITCLNMKPGLQLKCVVDLCSFAKKNQIDLIHTHNEKALFYGAISGLLSGIPVVHTKHGKNQITFKSRLRNHLLSHFCDRIVTVSRDAALQCIREEKISADKVMTIWNGVDTNTFSSGRETSSLKAALGINAGIPVIGIVARLDTVKDHPTLFAACRILKESGADFRLLVVGDGPLKDSLIKLTESLGLQRNITFTGGRRDVPDLMNVMDIFVLSSISEGISLTLIEAMACELPIVTTDAGGNPEVVLDGVTGFLVPPTNPSALAEKLLLLMNDSEARTRMGAAGRMRAVGNFSIEKSVQEYEKCYRQNLGNT